jgi:Holliday junction resolvasome RuvABC endonuclease subunit
VTSLDTVLTRIANATGAIRVRSQDAIRAERNGDLHDRLTALIEQLERIADDLEATLV